MPKPCQLVKAISVLIYMDIYLLERPELGKQYRRDFPSRQVLPSLSLWI